MSATLPALQTSTADGPAGHALLLHDIPRTAGITAGTAHCVLHTYLGGPTAWSGHQRALDAAQQRRLRTAVAEAASVAAAPGVRTALSDADCDLLAALQRDGRATTCWSPATVARRPEQLRSGGRLFFDVELDSTLLGVSTQALLWMGGAPAHLDQVGRTLARHPEPAYVAAVTGPHNLTALALCPDPAALHRYLTERLGTLKAIRTWRVRPCYARSRWPDHSRPPASRPCDAADSCWTTRGSTRPRPPPGSHERPFAGARSKAGGRNPLISSMPSMPCAEDEPVSRVVARSAPRANRAVRRPGAGSCRPVRGGMPWGVSPAGT